MNSRLYDRVATKILAIAILGFIASLIFRQSLLGSTSIIKLNRGSYLSGAISQSLASTSSAAKIGINYSITNQEFFDNNLYSVVLVRPLNHSSFAGVIVFKKLDPLMERLAADRLHELEALLIAMAALHDLQLQGKNLLAECNEGRINKQESTEMTIFKILP